MLFMLRFYDKPDTFALRQRLLPAHLAWLESRKQSIKLAGSLRAEPDGNPDGACWLVEAENFAGAERCYLDDPFWVEGMRERVEVRSLSKTFDGKVEV